ncbi:MAG: UDP-4-amino-4,6-dideoxy-N-acetyl-beta-L-altrosamine transaminase [Calditerrivibrio nitroreducens]|uniref:UDP-4-amino-4, 6-dideoxy-N-acetyl-beta-L-altrosamine transaminase n=1 Tax=Calditerrivibrio nitroreducens TaxID=477976 RepID=A0A2J6WH42_9BACT|nr:MAG: UDP-4-amino-4,6-dideoxy-N-acetyl-beta-L-altrosamine transaminase [Calditerrivibrio nitroreducens]
MITDDKPTNLNTQYRYITYGKQYIDDEDINAVVEVLKSDFLTQGPKVKQFEDGLAEYCGSKYAVVFNSGTSALHGAYFVAGLSKDDEFITSAMTFVATSNAGIYLGAKPVFVDVESDTGNIDVDLIEDKISEKTKLIVPIHYAGHSCDMEKIRNIADRYQLKVVEDACHALGARYTTNGLTFKVGSCQFSDMTVFSFHPVKHITTGEGGAVLTNDYDLYEKLLLFRNHGITKEKRKFNKYHYMFDGDWYYEMQFLGYNYRMTEIQAALGISQLNKLDRFVLKRREIVDIYNSHFKGNVYFDIPLEKGYAFHSYHLYPIRLKDRYKDLKKEIFELLRKNGIGVQVHYIPVYHHPFYESMGYEMGICKDAEDFYQREISLPIYPAMTEEDISYVIDKTYGVFKSL